MKCVMAVMDIILEPCGFAISSRVMFPNGFDFYSGLLEREKQHRYKTGAVVIWVVRGGLQRFIFLLLPFYKVCYTYYRASLRFL